MLTKSILAHSDMDKRPDYPLILGDSHAIYMAKAYGELNITKTWQEAPLEPINVLDDHGLGSAALFPLNPKANLFISDGRKIWMNQEILQKIRSQEYTHAILSLDGNIHNSYFMLTTDQVFDFLDPGVKFQFTPGAQIIPRKYVIDFFLSKTATFVSRLRLLRLSFPGLPLFFIAPPPPIACAAQIQNNPEIFDLTTRCVSNEFFRLRIYRAFLEVINHYCNLEEVVFVPPPACGMDESGFLDQRFWNQSTHASPEYYQQFLPTLRLG